MATMAPPPSAREQGVRSAYAMECRAEILEARGEHEQADTLRARAAEAERLY